MEIPLARRTAKGSSGRTVPIGRRLRHATSAPTTDRSAPTYIATCAPGPIASKPSMLRPNIAIAVLTLSELTPVSVSKNSSTTWRTPVVFSSSRPTDTSRSRCPFKNVSAICTASLSVRLKERPAIPLYLSCSREIMRSPVRGYRKKDQPEVSHRSYEARTLMGLSAPAREIPTADAQRDNTGANASGTTS